VLQISDFVDVLSSAREEIAREARSREADAAAHVELVRLKHHQLVSTHEMQKKLMHEKMQAHDEMKVSGRGFIKLRLNLSHGDHRNSRIHNRAPVPPYPALFFLITGWGLCSLPRRNNRGTFAGKGNRSGNSAQRSCLTTADHSTAVTSRRKRLERTHRSIHSAEVSPKGTCSPLLPPPCSDLSILRSFQ
jgi:hypothetical protein